ncbi:hypothetical protein NH26_24000 [Flammeovirga pacifica]|uniref:histidine kinase n=1 Tax=Flammeovirga pacifica TaxID=915059 RepID=A0A1S1YUD4_FLAPC|nr:hypothetical protein NH26_24000 [Flammeovirga pacifica]
MEFSHVDLSDDNILSKRVRCFLEDDKGYLWFGTTKGLYRYDGYEYKKYLSEKNICALELDEEGNIWITSFRALLKYNYAQDTFENIDLPIENFTAFNIKKLKSGEMFFASNLGFCLINPKTEEIKNYQKIPGLENGLSSNIIRTVYEDTEGNLWIGTHDQLNFFDRKNERFSKYRIQKENELHKKNNLILDIIPYDKNDDQFLIIGTETGLAFFDRRLKTFKKYTYSKNEHSLTNNVVKSICRVSDDEIWIGTGNGLNIFDVKTQKFERFYASYQNHFSISDDLIFKIYKDKNGIVWLGTNNGIDKIEIKNDTFLTNRLPHSEAFLKMGTTVKSFAFAENGDIWLGTIKKGLIKYDKKLDKYINFQVPQILHSDVKDILIDRNQNIWVATPGGLNFIDHKTGKIYAYVADIGKEDALQTDYLFSISESKDGDIWLGGMKGLYKINQLGNHQLAFKNFTHDPTNKNSISGNFIVDVIFNNNNSPWVLTGNGADIFNTNTGSITHIQKPEGKKNHYLNQVLFNEDGSIFILIGKNLYNYNVSTKEYDLILTSATPIKSCVRKNNDLWYTTHSKLIKYNLGDQSEVIYSSRLTGLNSYNQYAVGVQNDRIYLGGENGFVNFNYGEVNIEAKPSNVLLTGIKILNTKIYQNQTYNERVMFDKPFDELKKLTLSHEENSFTFNFSTLDFRKDDNLFYKVKLEGLEDDWQVIAGNRNEISYVKVKPGNYTFMIQVTDSFGNYSDNITKINVEVNPPLWATWWAKLFYFIFLCGLFYLAHKLTVSNINFQNKFELEKVKREQSDEVHSMKMKFFTNVSHELRTPLTLISSPLEELKALEDDRQKLNLLNIITRNTDRLSRLVNQVLDLRKIDQGGEKLSLSSNDIVKLSRSIMHDFMDAALQRSINLNFYTDQKESLILFDFEKMEKVIYNLVTNALKYTPDNGEIKLKLDQVKVKNPLQDGQIATYQRITIIDSGLGISKENQDQIFERFVNVKMNNFIGQQGTGIGLSLVNDYVKMHSGWIDLKSEEGKGSEFTVYLPLIHQEEDTPTEEIIEDVETSMSVEEEMTSIEEESDNTQPKLLIIEDDRDMQEFLVHCFESKYQVVTANNGKEGWDKAKKQMPDLIISDWMMPEMNGIELCNKLKSNILTNHIPVIILTAKGGMENKMEGIEKGADDYISKPFNVEYLRVRVQNIIHQRTKLNERIKREFGVENEENTMPSFEEKFLNEVMQEIEKNIDNSEFNVKSLGECIGMGQTNLYRKIKSMTGMTVNEFIRTVRLKKAGQLLKNGEYNVSDVMYMVGFTHRSYFSKSFKEMYGMSPKEYTKDAKSAVV